MSVEERVTKIVCEQLGVGEDEVNLTSSFVAVSYTHLRAHET